MLIQKTQPTGIFPSCFVGTSRQGIMNFRIKERRCSPLCGIRTVHGWIVSHRRSTSGSEAKWPFRSVFSTVQTITSTLTNIVYFRYFVVFFCFHSILLPNMITGTTPNVVAGGMIAKRWLFIQQTVYCRAQVTELLSRRRPRGRKRSSWQQFSLNNSKPVR